MALAMLPDARSALVVLALYAVGYRDVAHLDGGLAAWVADGRTLMQVGGWMSSSVATGWGADLLLNDRQLHEARRAPLRQGDAAAARVAFGDDEPRTAFARRRVPRTARSLAPAPFGSSRQVASIRRSE
jgi:hypothetical protein